MVDEDVKLLKTLGHQMYRMSVEWCRIQPEEGTFDKQATEHYVKQLALLKENLRDNMTNIELVLNMLVEVTTTALSRQEKPETFAESKMIAREGGATAKEARVAVEKRLKKSVVTSLNASDKPALESKLRNPKTMKGSESKSSVEFHVSK